MRIKNLSVNATLIVLILFNSSCVVEKKIKQEIISPGGDWKIIELRAYPGIRKRR
jgi:hypothetical protein